MADKICPVCGAEVIGFTTRIYCSEKCHQKDYRRKTSTKIGNLKKLGLEEAEHKRIGYDGKYCPFSCPDYKKCSKRGKDEFEYISSGGGRWRAVRGC